MVAVRLFSRAEIIKRLEPYRCKFLQTIPPGFELWETGWGEAFTLKPEPNGSYDEWQYFEIVSTVIATTMPENWKEE